MKKTVGRHNIPNGFCHRRTSPFLPHVKQRSEKRLHEDSQLLQALGECKGELPSMQRAYAQFWEKALSQYEEETQRLMRITQGAMEEAANIAQERIEITNGNAPGSGASSSSMPPSPMKRASPSQRDRA